MASATRTPETAEKQHPRAIPAMHGVGRGEIVSDDTALILEALRLASVDLRETAAGLARRLPDSLLIDRLNVFADQMDDLHTRLSA